MDFHCCVIFMRVGTCVNKVEAIYGRSCVNVKVYLRSTITFTRGLFGIHCLYFIWARKNYATVEIHPKRLKCCSRNRDDLSCLKPFLLFIAKCERRVSNRPFPHYAPVSKHKEMRTRLGWTISYKSLYFVHPSLKLVLLFTGMRERSIALKQIIFWDLLGISFPIDVTDICHLNFPLKQKKFKRKARLQIFPQGPYKK